MTQLIAHAIADLFPMMSQDEYEALKADIKANGQLEPIALNDGRIIDGRHRYRACCELGIKPKTTNVNGDTSLVAFVVSKNLKRRNLTSGQISAIGIEAAEYLDAEQAAAKQRLRQSPGRPRSDQKPPQRIGEVKSHAGEATEIAAKLLGTNRQYLADAKKIKEQSPELHAEVKSGKKTLPQARNELRKREKTKELEKKAAMVAFAAEAPMWTLINQDVLDGLQSVLDHHPPARLVFADPPYNIGIDYGNGEKADRLSPEKYMLWASEWLALCSECLTNDGSLWVMISDEFAAEYNIAIKKLGLTIRSWIKWYESFGVNCQSAFNRTSRHIFYAVKNPKRFVFNEDAITRPSDRQAKYNDKRANPGGKIWDDVWGVNPPIPRLTGTCEERIPSFPTQLPLAVVTPIVLTASDPGDLVIDPFCGSGTTGVVSVNAKRNFIGIEKSEKFIDLADKRLKVEAPVQ